MTITLIVEDGTGVANANSYVALADADTFFAGRGDATWPQSGNEDVKTGALVRAAQYLETLRYKGARADSAQSLKWPRCGVEDEDGRCVADTTIPTGVKNAQMVLALYAMSASLQPNEDRGGMVKREKVGELEIEYMDGAPPGTTLTEAWSWLREWAHGGNDLLRG